MSADDDSEIPALIAPFFSDSELSFDEARDSESSENDSLAEIMPSRGDAVAILWDACVIFPAPGDFAAAASNRMPVMSIPAFAPAPTDAPSDESDKSDDSEV